MAACETDRASILAADRTLAFSLLFYPTAGLDRSTPTGSTQSQGKVMHALLTAALREPSRALLGLAFLASVPGIAHAGLVVINSNTTVQASPYAPVTPPSATGISSIDLTGKVGANNFTLSPTGGGTVTVVGAGNGSAQSSSPVVQGTSANNYAAPVMNSSGAMVATPYLSTGGAPGTITLTFSGLESYFGLLWGSIDVVNTLSFYNGTSLLATVTGQDAQNAGVGFTTNGSQTFGGSQYTLVNFLNGTQFNKIVFSQANNGLPSFEAASLQYAARNVNVVPEPASIALIGLGLGGLMIARRRRGTVA